MTDWNRANFFYKRAETNFHNNEYEKAIDLYSQAIEILYRRINTSMLSFVSECLNSRGLCYYELGQFKNAIDDLTMSLDNKPNNAQGWLFLGSSHLRVGNLEKGIECLIYSVELEPEDLFAWNMKAYGNLLKSDLDSAKNDINHVLKNDPENEWAKNNLRWIDDSNKYFKEEANFFQDNINNKNINVNIHQGLNIQNIFKGHNEIITNIILTEGGKTVISVDRNNSLLIWKVHNRKIIYEYQNDSTIKVIKFISDNQFVFIDKNLQLKIINYINKDESIINIKEYLSENAVLNLDISPDRTNICISISGQFGGGGFLLIDLSTKQITNLNLRNQTIVLVKDAFFANDNKSIFFLNDPTYPYKGLRLYNYDLINRDIRNFYLCEEWLDKIEYSNDRENLLCWNNDPTASFDKDGTPIYNGSRFDILFVSITNRKSLVSWSIKNLPPFFEYENLDFFLSANGDIIVFNYGPFNYVKHKELNIHGEIIFAVWESQKNMIGLFHFPKGIQKIALSNDGEFALISSEKEIYICELETYNTKTPKNLKLI